MRKFVGEVIAIHRVEHATSVERRDNHTLWVWRPGAPARRPELQRSERWQQRLNYAVKGEQVTSFMAGPATPHPQRRRESHGTGLAGRRAKDIRISRLSYAMQDAKM